MTETVAEDGGTAPGEAGADTSGPRCIALDGPAAAGKSTVGRRLAERFGHLYLDTGAIYRALTWSALERGVPVDDAAALRNLADAIEIRVAPAPTDDPVGYRVTVDGRDITGQLRRSDVDGAVSSVSRHSSVRERLLQIQRSVVDRGPTIMVGRDIGTVVLPDADLKVYLDASAEERARRRYREQLARGDRSVWREILEKTEARDARDAGRDVAPMRPADDAVVVRTDGCTQAEVVDHLAVLVERWPDGLTTGGGAAPCGERGG